MIVKVLKFSGKCSLFSLSCRQKLEDLRRISIFRLQYQSFFFGNKPHCFTVICKKIICKMISLHHSHDVTHSKWLTVQVLERYPKLRNPNLIQSSDYYTSIKRTRDSAVIINQKVHFALVIEMKQNAKLSCQCLHLNSSM